MKKSRKTLKFLAIIAFITVFGGYAATQLGYEKVISQHALPEELSDNKALETISGAIDDIKNLNTKDVAVVGEVTELTEDMIPEGYDMDYYKDPIYEVIEKDNDVIPVFDDNGKFIRFDEQPDGMLEMSDIDGMTWADKRDAGFDMDKDSDFDKDGLTDRDEIVTYKTDPYKKSTSGDMYTDGYKVEHGMDLFEKQDYDEDVVIALNSCPDEISLDSITADNTGAAISNVTGKDKLTEDVMLYAEYEVCNYSGKLVIDLANVRKDLTHDDIYVFVRKGLTGKLETCKMAYRTDSTEIIPQYDFEQGYTYYIYLVNRKSASKINSLLGDAGKVEDILNTESSGGSAIIYGCPILSAFGLKTMKIIVEDKGESTYLEKDYMAEEHNKTFCDNLNSYDDKRFSTDSRINIVAKREFFKKILPGFEYSGVYDDAVEQDKKKLFFSYKYVDIGPVYTEEEIQAAQEIVYAADEESVVVSSGFDPQRDEFPFKNFGSYISNFGNCAGISLYAAKLFNNKTVPTSGDFSKLAKRRADNGYYIVTDVECSWDITKDEGNITLNDPGIIDYKDKEFSKREKVFVIDTYNLSTGQMIKAGTTKISILDYDNMGSDEQNFIDMIGDYHTSLNNIDKGNEAKKGIKDYTYENVEIMKQKIDEGKVAIVCFVGDNTGHVIIVYGYEYKPSTPDEVNFLCYDTNFPGVKDYTCIKTTKGHNADGVETMEFTYTADSAFTSNVKPGTEYELNIYDEDENLLSVFTE